MSLTIQPQWFPVTRRVGRYVWDEAANMLYIIGLAVDHSWASIQFILKRRLSRSAFFEQASFIGVDALGISLILTLFSGMVIALQVAEELTKQGAGELVGALVGIAIMRELAPIMTGFAVIAMVGSAYAAELATMKIQSQIDALKVLHVDPIRYLIVPRLVAALAMLPLMTILTAMAGIVGGMIVSYFIADLNYNTFLESVWRQMKPLDVFGALLKASVFGGLIALLSTTIGLNTTGGSREVGVSTTRAVVWSFVAMAVADYFLSMMLFSGKN